MIAIQKKKKTTLTMMSGLLSLVRCDISCGFVFGNRALRCQNRKFAEGFQLRSSVLKACFYGSLCWTRIDRLS